LQADEPHLAHHFADLEQWHEAATLGMWTFLAMEVLFFGAVLTAYTIYRSQFSEEFQAASEHLGIAAPLWSRRAVQELIRRECGVRLAVGTAGEYLKRWGYTPKKPRRHARHQDPEEVRQWLEETYPALERRADREGATIFWCDETGVVADACPARGYAREGQPATLDVPEPHVRSNQVAAISNDGKVRFLTYAGTMHALLFICHCLPEPGRTVAIAIDATTYPETLEHDFLHRIPVRASCMSTRFP
jgi:hypothetical protein